MYSSRIEALHLGGDLGREVGGVKAGDQADAGNALDQVRPHGRLVVADRGHKTQPGDGHAGTVAICHRQ